MFIAMTGSPHTGYAFFGPFADGGAAEAAAVRADEQRRDLWFGGSWVFELNVGIAVAFDEADRKHRRRVRRRHR